MHRHNNSQSKESRHSNSSTSLSLIEKVRRGDSESWSRLIRLYTPLVYLRLRRLGLSETDAADVAQVVFCKLHQGLKNFEHDPPRLCFRNWLNTIARNAMIDFVNKRKRSVQAAGGTDMNQRLKEVPDTVVEDDLQAETPDERTILVRQALKIIQNDFEPRSWQAFWMTSVEGLTSREAAERLDMKPAAVRKAKERILKRLHETLSEEFAIDL